MQIMDTRQATDLLANHPDFEIFKTTIFKTYEITKDDVYPSGGIDWEYQLVDFGNEYHVRLNPWLRIGFDDKMTAQLQKRFDTLNSKTEKLKFNFTDTCDFDEEEGERTWAARIYFKVVGI
jgi:hypothetical protein